MSELGEPTMGDLIEEARRRLSECRQRAETAERERDEAREMVAAKEITFDLTMRLFHAAERDRDRHRKALRAIDRVLGTTYWDDPSAGVQSIVRAALNEGGTDE